MTGIRTRDVATEGLDDLRYAIKSLDIAKSNWDLLFLRMTENVIYFTIYGSLVLCRKLKIHRKISC